MTITTGAGKKFMEELPLAIHTLFEGTPDTIKVALYGPNATVGPTTDAYTTDGEISGGGYSAGGDALTGGLVIVGADGSTRADGAQFDEPYINPLSDLTFTVSGVAIRGLMMYNSSQSNRNIFTLDLGATVNPSVSLRFDWDLAAVTTLNDALIPLIGRSTS